MFLRRICADSEVVDDSLLLGAPGFSVFIKLEGHCIFKKNKLETDTTEKFVSNALCSLAPAAGGVEQRYSAAVDTGAVDTAAVSGSFISFSGLGRQVTAQDGGIWCP
jgi:hypothetical protein